MSGDYWAQAEIDEALRSGDVHDPECDGCACVFCLFDCCPDCHESPCECGRGVD